MSKAPFLPHDLHLAVRRGVLMRLARFLLAEAAVVLLLILCGNRLFAIEKVSVKYACYAVILLIPFALTGVPFKMLDRSCFGTVERVKIKSAVANPEARIERSIYTNTIVLTIRKDNGRRTRKKAYEGKAECIQSLEKYKVGDRVFHLCGTKHVIVLPTEAEKNVQCAFCGDVNDKTNEACRGCGHTLIIREPEKAPPQIQCPHCGNRNDAANKACRNCGRPLTR